MLGNRDVMATVAVSDLARARAYYGGKLGLTLIEDRDPEVLTYSSGAGRLVVYRSRFAGTNQATAATWSVGEDLERMVAALATAGITFEHYDIPGAERRGDIHHFGPFRGVWMKDPDGNILHINSA